MFTGVENCARTPPMLLPVEPLPCADSRSRTRTPRQPADVRWYAMLDPTIPPPMMTTSAVSTRLPSGWTEHSSALVFREYMYFGASSWVEMPTASPSVILPELPSHRTLKEHGPSLPAVFLGWRNDRPYSPGPCRSRRGGRVLR